MDKRELEPKPGIESSPMRNYHKGDSFYIPENAARAWNKRETALGDLQEGNEQMLTPGSIVIVLEPPKEPGSLSNAIVKCVFPDKKEITAEISRVVLDTFPSDRRYGRALTAINMNRAKEIAGIVAQGPETEKPPGPRVIEKTKAGEPSFRITDKAAEIEKLRFEAGMAVFNVK